MTGYNSITTESLIAALLEAGADENTAVAGALWLNGAVSHIEAKRRSPDNLKALRKVVHQLNKAAAIAGRVEPDLQDIIERWGLGAAQFVGGQNQRAHGALATVLFRWAKEFDLPETLSTSSLLVRVFSTITGQDQSVAVKTLQALRLEESS